MLLKNWGYLPHVAYISRMRVKDLWILQGTGPSRPLCPDSLNPQSLAWVTLRMLLNIGQSGMHQGFFFTLLYDESFAADYSDHLARRVGTKVDCSRMVTLFDASYNPYFSGSSIVLRRYLPTLAWKTKKKAA